MTEKKKKQMEGNHKSTPNNEDDANKKEIRWIKNKLGKMHWMHEHFEDASNKKKKCEQKKNWSQIGIGGFLGDCEWYIQNEKIVREIVKFSQGNEEQIKMQEKMKRGHWTMGQNVYMIKL